MNQERLNALLYMFVEQKVTNLINYDKVIEKFKILTAEKRSTIAGILTLINCNIIITILL